MVIKILKKVKALTLGFFKICFTGILNLFGFKLLNQDQTYTFLKDFEVAAHPANKVNLPKTVVCKLNKTAFEANVAESKVSYVWSFDTSGTSVKQLKNGAIKVDDQVLCTDHDHLSIYKAIVNFRKRKVKTAQTLIAPFSQFCDGVFYGGYYDFVFLVFAKLCRIKDAMPAEEFANAVVAYPLFKTPYETEYLNLLGIVPNLVVNSSVGNVKFSKVIMGNSGHWFYPNMADIQAIKKYVSSSLQVGKTKKSRVYISRKTRRKIINEAELIVLLKKFGFLIIEDHQRTVAQQIEIYKTASFIIGPHGASFSNIIWCDAGTQLFELFSPNYKPDFFRYLAGLMELPYAAYYHGEPESELFYTDALTQDIYISVSELEDCLTALLKPKPVPTTVKNTPV